MSSSHTRRPGAGAAPDAEVVAPADAEDGRSEIATREELHEALQTALALELAIIPVYLYGLFSLRRDRNQQVAEIIHGVVMQEMLHLALVGNILNAVGATPRIGRTGFVPRYPDRLPGGVLPDLVVSLRRCSIEQVRDVFMQIELPHAPQDEASRRTLASIERRDVSLSPQGEIRGLSPEELDEPKTFFQGAAYGDDTIGRFYQRIARGLITLDRQEDLFTGDPRRQVVWPTAPGRLYRVTNLHTALWAIVEIIRQGEGTSGQPVVGIIPGTSHTGGGSHAHGSHHKAHHKAHHAHKSRSHHSHHHAHHHRTDTDRSPQTRRSVSDDAQPEDER